MSAEDSDAPPVGEEIHLPGESLLPLLTGAAITMIIIGSTIFRYISYVGIILFVVCALLWIRDTRRDMEELPEEHH
ncbi:MAG: hypothetical protein JOZ07_11270 [Solirubrobacterales bacterium]|nr:hypothetical protein [Solirubrobacterales bacterium]